MLILVVPDIEAAVDFYTRLGFKKRFHLKDQWAEFGLGDIKFGICPTSQQLPERHTGIVLETENLAEVQQWLQEQRIEFLEEPKVAPHGIMASIKDTGNNIIDLYQPTPEKVQDLIKQVVEKEDCCKEGADDSCCSDKDLHEDGCCS